MVFHFGQRGGLLGCLRRRPTPIRRLFLTAGSQRVFKTRALACEACHQGRVTIAGQAAKPSRRVRCHEVMVVRKDNLVRQFKVLQLLDRRVSAAKAKEYAEDQTSPSELEKKREPNFQPFFFRPKGSGRPPKKERRDMGQGSD